MLNSFSRLDKTAYVPGETAKLQVDVQNSSSVDIDSFIVKVHNCVTSIQSAEDAVLNSILYRKRKKPNS